MAINLVALVMQFLTPDMIGRVATALGLDRNLVQSAIGAAVPGLLAGFSGVATQPGGSQRLIEAAKQETGTLGRFADMLGTQGQAPLVERGSQMLGSLLGVRDQNALADAISRFAGLAQGKSSSLLGMLAPVIMGTVAGQQGNRGFDASGVANLFASQKENIAAALPADFAKLLSGTGLLSSLGGAAAALGNQATRTTSSAAGGMDDASRRAGATASASLNWLWLIPVAAIAALLIYQFSKPAEQVAQQGVTAAQNLTVGGVDLGNQVTEGVRNLRTALGSVTDAGSAQAALPKLQEVTAKINQVDGLIAQLTPEQRKLLAGIVNPLMPSLNQLFDKVLAVPGVAELLKPTIDVLRSKFAMLSA